MNEVVLSALLANGTVEELKAVLQDFRNEHALLDRATKEVEGQQRLVVEALAKRQEASLT
jgi:hypothetical protein